MSISRITGNKIITFGAENSSTSKSNVSPVFNSISGKDDKDSFSSEKKKETESSSSKLIKYAGLIALAAIPVTAVILNKNFSKTTQKLSNQISSMSNKMEGMAAETSNTVTEELSKNPEGMNKIVTGALTGALGGAAALAGIKELFKDGKLNLPDDITQAVNIQKKKENEKPLPESTEEEISSQISERIEGNQPWPEIENPKGWMVTAEVEGIVKTGGLAEVARQLPDAFNDKYKDNPEKKMDIVAPLYLQKGKVSLEPVEGKENKFKYTAGKTVMELTKISTLPIKVYDDKHERYTTENADVLTGKIGNTNYIFLRNDKYFDIKGSPYAVNKNNIGETERMAYFSKAAYDAMIAAKEGKMKLDAPNIVLANDWHASMMTGLMRYKAPIEEADNKISKETLDYVKNTPVVYLVHNNMYQGADYANGDKIFKTLFEDYDESLANEVKIGGKDGDFRFADGIGAVNASSFAINLADRVVPVSPNYAKELASSTDFGDRFTDIYKEREEHGTMQGITNGYDKVKTEPNEKTAKTANELNPDRPFKAFAGKYNDEGYAIKLENKDILFDYVKDIIPKYVDYAKDENKEQPIKGVELYQPDKCDLSKVDVDKTPFIVSVGRLTEQKGVDYMCSTLERIYSKYKNEPEKMPVTMILGSDGEEGTPNANQIKQLKDKLAESVSEEAANRVLFFEGFSAPLATALRYGGDFMPIPSKWEPCGLTQIEAMGVGAVPVALPTGGLPITIRDGEDGFLASRFYGHNNGEIVYSTNTGELVPPSNNVDAFSQAMGKAIDTYYNDKDKIKEMSIAGMKRDFSWNRPEGALEKYENLMTTGKAE